MKLEGKHVLITGAAKRVGRAIAERLIPHHVHLSAHYRSSKNEIESLAQMAVSAGSKAETFAADLSSLDEIRTLVSRAEGKFGPVDILINSASDFFPTPTLVLDEREWDHFLNLNLRSQFFLAQACGRTMVGRGGLVINLADVHGSRPIKNYLPYQVSKAGLLMMTKALAKEWAPKVRVNSISPGPVCLPESYSEEKAKRSAESTLLKRIGSPDDIASAALFLIENDYVTGFDLAVDGGRSIA